ncbi:DUF1444 domain-containing protein [Rossellomorea vietnamensis]|uniref:UPF0354 protein FZC84_15115 n=1 Tax=Rossellomorea vietnamensis TaxID=218284 RepID=A0A5D4MB86_9BACI|nr:DUF1444 domain-containing protein [Rossellomorea vietnamensis]TYR98240.1 DUF1444 domain-containing protein [Rossellomorea vietnamensis]
MDAKKMRKRLEERLSSPDRKFLFDREKEVLRIENINTGKGISITLAPIVAKWEVSKEKAIDEVVYYVEEALDVMGYEHTLTDKEKKIFPVIRSTSFPTKTHEDVAFITEEHTAETRIYYAVDLGSTYRMMDEKMLQAEEWTAGKVKEAARFNLRSLPVKLKQDTLAGNVFHFLNTNDGYDASRILNSSFLNEMKDKTEGEMTISVPHQDVLIIGDIRNETGYDILAELSMSFFTNGKVPITSLSFLYEDNELEPIFILAQDRKSGREK